MESSVLEIWLRGGRGWQGAPLLLLMAQDQLGPHFLGDVLEEVT